jgi:general stress protein 26
MTTFSSPHRTLWDLIKEVRLGMMTHRHPDGTLHAHPLTTQNRSLDEGVLYFFASRATELASIFPADAKLSLRWDAHLRTVAS